MSTPLYEPSEVQSHVWGNCYVWFLQPLATARCYNPYYPLCTKPHVLSSLQTHFYHRVNPLSSSFTLTMTASLHNSLDGTPFFHNFLFSLSALSRSFRLPLHFSCFTPHHEYGLVIHDCYPPFCVLFVLRDYFLSSGRALIFHVICVYASHYYFITIILFSVML